MIEQALNELLELARERLERTDDPYRREKLAHGITLGQETLSFLEALRPVVARQIEQVLGAWYEGGLFEGDNARTHDDLGLGSQD